MKDKLSSKKFILAILGLACMCFKPEIAAYVVSLLVPVILGIAAIDHKKVDKSKE
jgi:hypothetical protein